jgi:hypothetical protein
MTRLVDMHGNRHVGPTPHAPTDWNTIVTKCIWVNIHVAKVTSVNSTEMTRSMVEAALTYLIRHIFIAVVALAIDD